MTPEELLKPRYQVIVYYPFSTYSVGDILYQADSKVWFGSVNPETGNLENRIHINVIEACPNVFKKLKWWVYRDLEDMPAYVRWRHSGLTHKVLEWKPNKRNTSWMCNINTGYVYLSDILPAIMS